MPDDEVVVLHRGRVVAAGEARGVIAEAGAADMRSAFMALTDSVQDEE
jgi:ABC-2 type transport system ATP-binding protein